MFSLFYRIRKTGLRFSKRPRAFSWHGSHKKMLIRNDVILTCPYSSSALLSVVSAVRYTIRLTGRSLIRTKSLIRAVLRLYWHKDSQIIENPLYNTMNLSIYIYVLCVTIQSVLDVFLDTILCWLLNFRYRKLLNNSLLCMDG